MNAEDLVITFKRDMTRPSRTERRRAIESVVDVIREAAFDDAAGSACEVERCPRCESVAIVKKGKSKNGEQRHLCRGCGCEFDETYFPESFKDNHTTGSFTMLRSSRHRGRQV